MDPQTNFLPTLMQLVLQNSFTLLLLRGKNPQNKHKECPTTSEHTIAMGTAMGSQKSNLIILTKSSADIRKEAKAAR